MTTSHMNSRYLGNPHPMSTTIPETEQTMPNQRYYDWQDGWMARDRQAREDAEDRAKDEAAMGYLTADEGNCFGSTEGL